MLGYPTRRRGGVTLVALVLTITAAAARPGAAAEMTWLPAADTFVSAAEPVYNYGAAGAVEVSGPNTPNGEYQGLLKFNTREAKDFFDRVFGAGGWKLDSASLRLATSNPNNPIFNANAAGPVLITWMQNDSWQEGTGGPTTPATDGITYATLRSFLSAADEAVGTINFPGGTGGANAYGLPLTPAFRNDLISGGDVSLRLSAGAGASTSYLFASRTFNVTANRPTLTLAATAVPEPGAGLTALGIAALVLRRRSRAG